MIYDIYIIYIYMQSTSELEPEGHTSARNNFAKTTSLLSRLTCNICLMSS